MTTSRKITTRSEHRSFGGVQGFYEHESALCGGPMRFSLYLPPAALAGEPVPVLYYLPGLTCTEENFPVKAGGQRIAAELGLALVSSDTSPRAVRFPGDDASEDFGQGAGFYLDATLSPWATVYRMASYVRDELRQVVESSFPIAPGAAGIFGHSMGGHGALTLALKNPQLYRSVSALAPIVNPSQVPWGQKAFGRYLGDDRAAWAQYDATELVARQTFPGTILIDQGTSDKFLTQHLFPERFEAAAKKAGQSLVLNRREGYDHSYYFVATFIGDHLRHHAAVLRR